MCVGSVWAGTNRVPLVYVTERVIPTVMVAQPLDSSEPIVDAVANAPLAATSTDAERPNMVEVLSSAAVKNPGFALERPPAVSADPKLNKAWDDAMRLLADPLQPVVARLGNLQVYGEAGVPKTEEEVGRQTAAIEQAIAAGYNTIMVACYPGDAAEDLLKVLGVVRKAGGKILFVLAAREHPYNHYNTPVDMAAVQEVLTTCIPVADYFMPTWRGSTAHHAVAHNVRFHMDMANVFIQMALRIRADIPIFGMIEPSATGMDATRVQNCSAVMYVSPVRSGKDLIVQPKSKVPVIYGPICYPGVYVAQDEVMIARLRERMVLKGMSLLRLHGNGYYVTDVMTRK